MKSPNCEPESFSKSHSVGRLQVVEVDAFRGLLSLG